MLLMVIVPKARPSVSKYFETRFSTASYDLRVLALARETARAAGLSKDLSEYNWASRKALEIEGAKAFHFEHTERGYLLLALRRQTDRARIFRLRDEQRTGFGMRLKC